MEGGAKEALQGEDERMEDNTTGEKETSFNTTTQVSLWIFRIES